MRLFGSDIIPESNTSNLCSNVGTFRDFEGIFRNMLYEPETKLIYTGCMAGPIGKVVMGKIKWFKSHAHLRIRA